MKRIFLIALAIISSSGCYAQINMNSSGKVLLGSGSPDPLYQFYVNGSSYFTCSVAPATPPTHGFSIEPYTSSQLPLIRPYTDNTMYLGNSTSKLKYIYTYNLNVNGVWITSDLKLKENIRPLTGSLNTISKLNPVKFDYKSEFFNNKLCYDKENLMDVMKNISGFIANEVQEVIPKLVEYNKESNSLEINYIGFIPELVQAIKEQQMIIDSLRNDIIELKKMAGINILKSKSASVNTNTDNIHTNTKSSLYQNVPNPFTESTLIKYYLADDVHNAMICIYDMNGRQLKCTLLNLTGYGNITISKGELKAGMYMYTLISNGQVVDTKQMILTD
jgi:hypothetical protein